MAVPTEVWVVHSNFNEHPAAARFQIALQADYDLADVWPRFLSVLLQRIRKVPIIQTNCPHLMTQLTRYCELLDRRLATGKMSRAQWRRQVSAQVIPHWPVLDALRDCFSGKPASVRDTVYEIGILLQGRAAYTMSIDQIVDLFYSIVEDVCYDQRSNVPDPARRLVRIRNAPIEKA